jgi:hypothetical protein
VVSHQQLQYLHFFLEGGVSRGGGRREGERREFKGRRDKEEEGGRRRRKEEGVRTFAMAKWTAVLPS